MAIEQVNFDILTPTYRRSDTFLPDCIESVRSQPDEVDGVQIGYRHIVVNVDRKDEAATSYLESESRKDARLLTETYRGARHTQNIGLNVACGISAENYGIRRDAGSFVASHVIMVDDDDMLAENTLGHYARAIVEDPRRELIFGKLALIDEHGTPIDDSSSDIAYNDVPYTTDAAVFMEQMLQANHIPRSAAIGHLAMITSGSFSPDIICLDWHAYARIIRSGAPYHMIDEVTDIYRQHAMQISRQHRANGAWELAAQRLRQDYASGNMPTAPNFPISSMEYATGESVGELTDGRIDSGMRFIDDPHHGPTIVFSEKPQSRNLGILRNYRPVA